MDMPKITGQRTYSQIGRNVSRKKLVKPSQPSGLEIGLSSGVRMS